MATTLSEQDIDWLAREGCDFIGFKSGSTVTYDVAGYQRCERVEVAPESLDTMEVTRSSPKPLPQQASFASDSYPVRLAGMRRNEMFGPDEIGALMRRYAIPWNDGLGNGLYESLRIDRKYGLKHVLEAPILGFDLPFQESEWQAFRLEYPQHVGRFMADLAELEDVYGGPLAGHGERMIVLWTPHYPLAHFYEAYKRDPSGVQALLRQEIGQPLPPLAAVDSKDRAILARFWSYIRRQQAEVPLYQSRVLRQMMGQGLTVVANPHELPPLDMEAQATAYDYPAVAVRPLLLNDSLFLRHYVAYFTQLFHDLTEKPPMVSVRMNLSAASPQFIPGANLIRSWYDQAVRHGAGAFYFWTRDYPTNSAAETYDGPIPGNPVASTRPKERWESSLELLGHLATHCRFRVPPAEVAILVPFDSALLHWREWQRIYAAFSGCAEARIHSRFLSDRQVERAGIPAQVQFIVAPVLEFPSTRLRIALERFTNQGGILLTTAKQFYDRAGKQVARLQGAEQIDGAQFDLFSANGLTEESELQQLAQFMRQQTQRCRVQTYSWLFDVTCDHLPPARHSRLRRPEPSLAFSPWLYEHGSDWIVPYLSSKS